ncbi:MAG: hypothetical protein PHE09_01315 [Oscillospiraceae bacterium]|nr:hypothetical protein [Oscillospiraceae bacterium]
MAKREQPKLNYRFHNPNTPEATADFLIKLYVAFHEAEIAAIILDAQKEIASAKNKRRRTKQCKRASVKCER